MGESRRDEDFLEIIDRLNGCGQKRRYDEIGARAMAAALTLKEGEQFVSYRCGYCGDWHAGHQRRGKKR